MSLADLTEQKVISARDLEPLAGKGIREIRVREGADLHPVGPRPRAATTASPS